MSPFLFGIDQDVIDQVHKEERVREHIAKYGLPASVAGSPSSPAVVADEADLSMHSDSESTHEETTIDQSVHGVSFINMHCWMGLGLRIPRVGCWIPGEPDGAGSGMRFEEVRGI